jgi:glyoxylase I family protein
VTGVDRIPKVTSKPAAPITGLSHVQLLVSDVAVSARWYRTVLGLLPFADDPAIGYVALQHRDAKLVIVLTPARDSGDGPRGPGGPCGPGHDGVDHLAFAVPDGAALEAWAAHLTAAGIDHEGVVPENDHPSLQLRDPDGIAIELVAP